MTVRTTGPARALLLVAALALPPAAWPQTPARLQREIAALNADRTAAERRLARAETRIAELGRRLAALRAKRRRLQRRQRELAQRLHSLDRRTRTARRRLAAQLRAAYLLRHRHGPALWFGADDPARLQRLRVYHRYLSRHQTTRLRQLQARLEETARLQARNRRLLARLQALLNARRRALAELQSARRQRRQAVAALERELQDRQARLRQLQAEQKRLRHLVDAVAATAAPRTRQAFTARKGSLPWPAAGRLAVRFGARRGSGRWEGVVIQAPAGTPVKAVHAGKVIFAGWMPGYGNLLILRHDHDFLTLYGFNRELLKQAGERVAAGEVIATVGNSGGRRRPGLYFAIRRGAEPVDPRHWCRRPRHDRVG